MYHIDTTAYKTQSAVRKGSLPPVLSQEDAAKAASALPGLTDPEIWLLEQMRTMTKLNQNQVQKKPSIIKKLARAGTTPKEVFKSLFAKGVLNPGPRKSFARTPRATAIEHGYRDARNDLCTEKGVYCDEVSDVPKMTDYIKLRAGPKPPA